MDFMGSIPRDINSVFMQLCEPVVPYCLGRRRCEHQPVILI